MTPNQIHLDVVTPERLVFSEVVDEVILPGSEGYLGVRPGHVPLMLGLGIGELSWSRGNRHDRMAVCMGYAEVMGNRVVVLAESAERATEIDTERAQNARRRAEEMMGKAAETQVDIEKANTALRRAATRISVAAKKK
jgi:F-type H+-transporting ATPase subunit epsilon